MKSIAAWTVLAISCALSARPVVEADARRGAEFFETQHCNTCHSVGQAVQAKQPGSAPDLARRLDRDYTPAGLVSRMWDHAPIMWSAMAKADIAPPRVDEQEAADLLAFFYSARYFNRPGDAARGRRVFVDDHCVECHAIRASEHKIGPSVESWQALADPIALVQQMWNHAPEMKAEFAKRKISWPELTSQNLEDLLVYLQNLPEMRGLKLSFTMPSSSGGAELFQSKGCAGCHHGSNALENKLQDATLTDVAAAMWDHAPRMKQQALPVTYDQMRQIVGYVWARQFFGAHGNADRGQRVFASKGCTGCHDQASSGAPNLRSGRQFSTITMISALWQHGPHMLAEMQAKSLPWPEFTASQMSDVIAYIARREQSAGK
jgi:mono/diheme cytochrome c family protein